VIVDFYMDGKTVKFGPIQPAYKEYLAEMRKWYAEGLLDPDFVSQDQKGFEAKVVGNRAASYAGLVNGHMGKFMGLKNSDPDFSLVGLPFPVGPAGKSYGDRNWNSTGQGIAVSEKCANKAAAMKWGDYMYTQDGIMLSNFGLEGLTYKMANGRPVYTDLIMKNPDKLPVINALSKYLLVSSNGVLVQIEDSFRAMHDKRQQEASEGYMNSTDSALVMPPTQPAPKQAEVLAGKMNDVYTYVDEMLNKFVMGAAPLEDFDKYVATIRKMGIDEAAAIWQDAVDKYSKR
jgi:putative aldouronate transport system substrate-binding protein